jgi:hypothetical protein
MSNDSQRVLRGLLRGCVAAVLCAPLAATGQVRPVQDGQALDANPRIGSYGRNIPAPAEPRFDSQLYVTGQVSGLRRFRGTVGYFGDKELHLSLPSASLGDFRRRSVGLQDALQGRTYLPTPYYERTTTMLRADDILGGRAAPGTNIPAATVPTATPLGQRLYVDALAEFYTAEALTPGRALAPPAPTSLMPSLSPGAASVLTAAAAASSLAPAPVPETTPLFAVPRTTERAELVRELYRQARRDRLVDQRIDAKVQAVPEGTPRPGEAPPAVAPTADANSPAQPAETPGGPLGTRIGQPLPDRDVFMDLMMLGLRLRQRKRAATTAPATMPATVPTPAAAPQVTWTGRLVELSEAGEVIIHGLVGKSRDPFNARMAQAQEKLRAKRYYDAADLYETAGEITPHNPLARVGVGLSLLGAGESLSAAQQLRRAMALFPPMTQSRIDLADLIDAKVIEAELAGINDRLRHADDETRRMLQFLAMFLYYNSGQDAKAKPFAEKVHAAGQSPALLRAYAQFILRDREGKEEGAARQPPKTPSKDGAESPGR